MATTTVTTYWCDACLGAGRDVEAAASHVIAIDRTRVAVDFCDEHERGLLAALRDVVLTRGRAVGGDGAARPKGSSRSLALFVCPECGRTCSGGQGLAAHRRGAHSYTAAS